MSSVEARNIWKSLRGQQVLAGAELVVNAREAVGLFGRSGAGKSTFFNILLGVVPPDDGTVRLDGRPVDGLPTEARARLGLGYVPQRPFIPPQLTVRQTLEMAAEGALIADRDGAAAATMETLGIGHLEGRPLGKLSGGERRRVEIGYVLVTRPRYLLLDEPFAGLDPIAVASLIETLRQIVDGDIGLVVSDHNLVDAARLASRCYVLDNGVLTPVTAPSGRRHQREWAL